jgi:hypothetical protein
MRGAEQLIDGSAILRVDRCTRTHRKERLFVVVSEALGNSFRNTLSCVGLRFRENKYEFKPSVARSRVNVAAMNSENAR